MSRGIVDVSFTDLTKGVRIVYPENPKEGDLFHYLCPISGCVTVTVKWVNGAWKFVERL